MNNKCNCYHEEYGTAECWGTKERELCSCNGDQTKCDFYPDVRAKAKKNRESAMILYSGNEVRCIVEEIIAELFGFDSVSLSSDSIMKLRDILDRYGSEVENIVKQEF